MPAKCFMLTVSAGKRLIAKGIAQNTIIREAIHNHKLVVIAGTTNGAIMEELCPGFVKKGFFRGVTSAPGRAPKGNDPILDCVVTKNGVDLSRDIFSIVPELVPGDVILKGANAVYLPTRSAGVLIASPICGTVGASTNAVIGQRVRMILPVGVEKRVEEPIDVLARGMNAEDCSGPRLFPAPGMAYTEIDAFRELCGVHARIAAAGGVAGAEGATYFLCEGTQEQIEHCAACVQTVMQEPSFA